ncbi:hypothetical protein HMPREF9591_00789 [Cutibacterium acnes HL086PA1]|nr:hypothetical protein HMPREF9591_00789 [Cutibacterium acnes HL086PA1]
MCWCRFHRRYGANEDPSWKTMMVEVDEHFMLHRFQGCGSD